MAIALMWLIVLGGFWPFFSGLFQSRPDAHWVIYAHAAVFSGWMVLLAIQFGLVRTRRIRAHRRLGAFGVGYGVLLLVMGLVVTFVATSANVRAGRVGLDQAAGFLLEPLGDMLLFAGFFGAAIHFRRRPELHRPLMMLATVALLFPAAARLAGHLGAVAVLVTWLLPLGVLMAYEVVTQRRVARVFVAGALVLIVAFGRIGLEESEVWLAVGRRLLTPFVGG